jgi:hypothetical protein
MNEFFACAIHTILDFRILITRYLYYYYYY